MSKMVQIRNVPDALHRKLKSRAADLGQTLSDYLLTELERLAARPRYDAMYVALAEALNAPIVTCNRPLAQAPGHRAMIELIDGGP